MALKLDNALLEELGLGQLPDSEKQLLLTQIYEKLEMNVGMRLADQMSNDQLDAFEKFVDANDDKGAFQWLESNFPNYKLVVNEEFEKLKAEIHSVAPQILASAVQAPAEQPAVAAMPQPQAAQPAYQPSASPQPQPAAYPPQAQPQPSYPAADQPQPGQFQPASPAMPQAPSGHLQPQYGQYGQPQYSQPTTPPAQPQQPPAGPAQ